MLSGAGAAFGLLLASWSSRVLVRQLSTSADPVFLDLSIDGRILAFTVGIAAATTLFFGTAPALRASGVAPIDALRAQGRATAGQAHGSLAGWLSSCRSRSMVLVVAAGLFGRSFASLATRTLGFEPDQVLVVTIDAQRTTVDPSQRVPLYERARDAVRAVPGVADAAVSLTTPFSNEFTPPVEISGITLSAIRDGVFGNLMSAGWFRTFGTPLIAGRDLSDRDRRGAARVAVVNEAFARRFFGGSSALGRTITVYPHSPMASPPMEIVGVVGDAVYSSIRDPVPSTWYAPIDQFDQRVLSAELRSARLSVRSRRFKPALLTVSQPRSRR